MLAAALAAFAAAAFADSAQERYDRGAALLKERKLSDAKKEFEKAVELDPKHVDARRILAELLKKEGKPEAAAKHLEKALEVEPENVKIMGEIGNAYAEAAQNAAREAIQSMEKRDKLAAKAIEAYRKVIEKDPEFAPALYNLGTMQALSEKWADAMATLKTYVEKKPDDRRGLFNYAQACDKTPAPVETTIGAWRAYIEAAKGDPVLKKDKDVAFAEGRVKALGKRK